MHEHRRQVGGLVTVDLDVQRYAVGGENVELARRLLDEAGYRVIEAKNGGEAVARLDEDAAHAIQLLVTDAVMPDAGARDVIEIGQRIRPSLPVLVISGHSAELVDPDGELGVDVLAKPFTSEQLLRRVRAAIDRRTWG